jgi:hypothetical protein
VSEFNAWRPLLSPGATVVFHDFDIPAVVSGITAPGLDGRAIEGLYVWALSGQTGFRLLRLGCRGPGMDACASVLTLNPHQLLRKTRRHDR